ncbi:MAG: rhodanese-like domain-containing protein [Propionivibrio sp.]|nr:rhodanese-like domain-containing protein [Propionivibrio sp.]MBP6712056.1 rhodanese-like domain-containing protein [Propionivibrio sp.]MBP7525300.1 rhodanese-like domain-containing protein [Propionivibrio sp.]
MKTRYLASALLCSLLFTSPVFADDKFTAETAKEIEAVKLARDTLVGGYELLTVGELKKMIDDGKPMVVVDTMPESSFRKEHIPGARNLLFPVAPMAAWDSKETAGKTEADYAALLGEDKELPVVVYCGFVKCTRSDNGAAWAKKLGYKNVYRVPGGLFAWKGANLPLEEVK